MGFIKKHPYLFWQLTGLFILAIDFLYMWFNLDNEQISYAFIVLMGMVAFAVIILSPFVIKSRKRLKDIGEIAALHRYNYMEEWYAQTYGLVKGAEGVTYDQIREFLGKEGAYRLQ